MQFVNAPAILAEVGGIASILIVVFKFLAKPCVAAIEQKKLIKSVQGLRETQHMELEQKDIIAMVEQTKQYESNIQLRLEVESLRKDNQQQRKVNEEMKTALSEI
jgi:hypothetical protein